MRYTQQSGRVCRVCSTLDLKESKKQKKGEDAEEESSTSDQKREKQKKADDAEERACVLSSIGRRKRAPVPAGPPQRHRRGALKTGFRVRGFYTTGGKAVKNEPGRCIERERPPATAAASSDDRRRNKEGKDGVEK